MHAIAYYRFSPRRNAEECESIVTQRALVRAWCERAGHVLRPEDEYEDPELSGGELNRPNLWAAIAAVPRGGALVVYKLDRLARDDYIAALVRREVQKRGGRILSVCGEGTESPGAGGVFMSTVLYAKAAYDRAEISERTSAAMLRRQADGQRMSRPDRVPYGTRASGDRLVPDPEAMAKLILAQSCRAAGGTWEACARVLGVSAPANARKILMRHAKKIVKII